MDANSFWLISIRENSRNSRTNIRVHPCPSVVLIALFLFCAIAQAQPQTNSAAILQELKNFRTVGSVLYVAAHPDDEDTQLITFLARGRHLRTAYLSITRGDGGQNVLGPEFDAELGVIRTQELLAARRLDGGEQFFTRALDFGYSKDYRETLRFWDHQQVLSDVVRVIRTFQPDVVIAGFSTNQTPGQHGHHVASAILAGEAFKLAGDPTAFPDQLDYLKPWQPKRLLQNLRFFGRGGGTPPSGPHVEISGNDPVLGISYGEIAARSRAMHKSQGFGNFNGIGSGARTANFLVLDGEPATNDIMDGIDTTWSRIPGGAEIGRQADDTIAKFDPQNPSASVNTLLALHESLKALPSEPVVGFSPAPAIELKRKQLDKILQNCLGLSVFTTVPQAEVVAGESLELKLKASISSPVQISWLGIFYPGVSHEVGAALDLAATGFATRNMTVAVPPDAPLSQPYWLRQDPTVGMFRVADAKLIGRPETPLAFPVEYVFRVGDQTLIVADEPVQAGTESGKFEARRALKIIAPVALRCEDQVKLFAPNSSHDVTVAVTAARGNLKGELSLDTPDGWKVSPALQSFDFAAAGELKNIPLPSPRPRKPRARNSPPVQKSATRLTTTSASKSAIRTSRCNCCNHRRA